MPTTLAAEGLTLSVDALLPIGCGPHRAWVAAQAGGRLARLASAGHDWIVPVGQGSWAPHRWPKAGAYPLVPFSNRIRDGRFEANGKAVQLALLEGQPHALHGHGQFHAWEVVSRDDRSVRLCYRHEAQESGWPWSYTAWQDYAMHADGLRWTMTVRNDSDSGMPLGFGWHPYFTADAVAVSAGVNWVHEQEMAVRAEPLAIRDLTFGLDDQGYTAYLSEWDGRADLRWRNGARLQLQAGTLLRHLVVHRAAGRDYLCVEPVSLVCDAFNLEAAGHAGTGAFVLAAGDEVSDSVDMAMSL